MAIKKRFPYRAALVACNGGCRAAGSEDGGCKDGCIGCGACIEKCKFGAISMNEYGVAEVDEEKCIACGQCAKVCPQNLIKIHECANYINNVKSVVLDAVFVKKHVLQVQFM